MKKLKIRIVYYLTVFLVIITILSMSNVAFASWADLDDETADKISNEEEKNQEEKVQESVTKSNNNYLSSLTVTGYTLSPVFEKQTMEYKINDEIKTEEIEITAISESEKATISGTGKIKLESGENDIKIDVTAENGDLRTYLIKITKSENDATNNELNEEIQNSEIATSANLNNNQIDNKSTNYNYIIIIAVLALIILMIIIIIMNNKKSKHSK